MEPRREGEKKRKKKRKQTNKQTNKKNQGMLLTCEQIQEHALWDLSISSLIFAQYGHESCR